MTYLFRWSLKVINDLPSDKAFPLATACGSSVQQRHSLHVPSPSTSLTQQYLDFPLTSLSTPSQAFLMRSSPSPSILKQMVPEWECIIHPTLYSHCLPCVFEVLPSEDKKCISLIFNFESRHVICLDKGKLVGMTWSNAPLRGLAYLCTCCCREKNMARLAHWSPKSQTASTKRRMRDTRSRLQPGSAQLTADPSRMNDCCLSHLSWVGFYGTLMRVWLTTRVPDSVVLPYQA